VNQLKRLGFNTLESCADLKKTIALEKKNPTNHLSPDTLYKGEQINQQTSPIELAQKLDQDFQYFEDNEEPPGHHQSSDAPINTKVIRKLLRYQLKEPGLGKQSFRNIYKKISIVKPYLSQWTTPCMLNIVQGNEIHVRYHKYNYRHPKNHADFDLFNIGKQRGPWKVETFITETRLKLLLAKGIWFFNCTEKCKNDKKTICCRKHSKMATANAKQKQQAIQKAKSQNPISQHFCCWCDGEEELCQCGQHNHYLPISESHIHNSAHHQDGKRPEGESPPMNPEINSLNSIKYCLKCNEKMGRKRRDKLLCNKCSNCEGCNKHSPYLQQCESFWYCDFCIALKEHEQIMIITKDEINHSYINLGVHLEELNYNYHLQGPCYKKWFRMYLQSLNSRTKPSVYVRTTQNPKSAENHISAIPEIGLRPIELSTLLLYLKQLYFFITYYS